MKIIECVPNFSEGNDESIIAAILESISSIEGINLLDVDSGKDTNRTVVTFVGRPEDVIEAAFQSIKKASEFLLHVEDENILTAGFLGILSEYWSEKGFLGTSWFVLRFTFSGKIFQIKW